MELSASIRYRACSLPLRRRRPPRVHPRTGAAEYMAKRQRNTKAAAEAAESPETDSLIQLIGVYHVDLLSEVEGLLRSVTRAQQQVERLRPSPTTAANASQRREALKLLAGNLKTLTTKVDTLKETLPEIEAAVLKLENASTSDDDDGKAKAGRS